MFKAIDDGREAIGTGRGAIVDAPGIVLVVN